MRVFQPSKKSDHQAAWQFVVSNSRSVIDSSSKPFSRTYHAPTIAIGIRDAARDQIWGLMFINHLRFWKSFENLMKTSDTLPRKPCALTRIMLRVYSLLTDPQTVSGFPEGRGLRSIVIF